MIVYVIAIVTDALAPTFGGTKNQSNALKLVVYAMTPIWLAGVFLLIPQLRILGLYGLYLFWLGIPALMKAPDEKSALRRRGRAVRYSGFARHRDDRRRDHPGLTTRRLEVNIARR